MSVYETYYSYAICEGCRDFKEKFAKLYPLFGGGSDTQNTTFVSSCVFGTFISASSTRYLVHSEIHYTIPFYPIKTHDYIPPDMQVQ